MELELQLLFFLGKRKEDCLGERENLGNGVFPLFEGERALLDSGCVAGNSIVDEYRERRLSLLDL